ncbi:MAG: nicotinate (nicotinamide) nucleotide adenylyltransferase [Chloroflexi bacterium]|nr:nicotinate (nicotinamide) nucleotide adenylyltransferase [Chloroflexota bacterium]
MKRVGLLGGTFDPVHVGHLILAETARDTLRLDHVYFVPAADPPHKHGQVIAKATDRLTMLEMALADNPDFSISLIDLERPGPHFTADMVNLARQCLDSGAELWFLMGLDSLIDFPNWHDTDRIRHLARLAAATRPGYEIDWTPLEQSLPGIIQEVTLLPMPGVSIASNNLRRKIQHGGSMRYLVPESVRHYIIENDLYRI